MNQTRESKGKAVRKETEMMQQREHPVWAYIRIGRKNNGTMVKMVHEIL